MYDAVVIHVGELILKGGNRHFFEERLFDNLGKSLADVGGFRLERQQASIVLTPTTGQLDGQAMEQWRDRLRTVFGIANFMFVRRCPPTLEDIKKNAIAVATEANLGTFKVFAKRSDKSFPHDSPEINRLLGGAVLDALPEMRVDVHEPKLRLHVEVSRATAFVSPGVEAGAGGLPVGTSGRVVALLSGGIDSPVAAWKALKRGCEVVYVHFHSYPFVDRRSVDKARRLAEKLAPWQPDAHLYLVPFGEFQREVVAKCDPMMRIVLYRRMMLRVAETIAQREGALGIFTGDSLGQVASQTLENLETVTAAARLPIYRPLIGDDKEEIIVVAKRIGTYETAIEPHDDCCSLFMPPHPVTKASPRRAEAEEAKLDLAPYREQMLTSAETIIVKPSQAV